MIGILNLISLFKVNVRCTRITVFKYNLIKGHDFKKTVWFVSCWSEILFQIIGTLELVISGWEAELCELGLSLSQGRCSNQQLFDQQPIVPAAGCPSLGVIGVRE